MYGEPLGGESSGGGDGDSASGDRDSNSDRGDGNSNSDNNPRGWRLVVAIADVGHYVAAGGALDAEALKRGNSVYFPNRVVPMLPPQLSNGICSLNPGADRHCMVCDMRVSRRGDITAYQFYPALMHSKARLTYGAVADILAGRDGDGDSRGRDGDNPARRKWKDVAPHLDCLHAIARALGAQRKKRGSIDFDFPEAFIEFDEAQKIRRIRQRERNPAHRLIEECMLAANGCAARFLQQRFGRGGGQGGRAIFRNHYGPDADALANLRRALDGLDLKLGGGEAPRAGDYAALVAAVAGREAAPVVQLLLLRSLSQAEYATDPAGHFALAEPVYTHFTSPIRRYSDLVVHRQIRQLLRRGKRKPRQLVAPRGVSLEKVAEQCSSTERRAEDASRDVMAWLKAEFMQDKIGAEFDGTVSGVAAFGVFVQLRELFVDGLVHVTGLGDDYFLFDPLRLRLTGQRGGRSFQLGDALRVRLAAVSLDSGKIDFELCGVDARPTPMRWKKRGKKRR